MLKIAIPELINVGGEKVDDKAKQRDEIKEARKNFKGKSGVPYSNEERFRNEIEAREKEKREDFVATGKRGKGYLGNKN